MSFDFEHIAWSVVISGIGWVYFSFAKKQSKPALAFIGIVLMVYTYAVDNLILSIALGAALAAAPFILKLW